MKTKKHAEQNFCKQNKGFCLKFLEAYLDILKRQEDKQLKCYDSNYKGEENNENSTSQKFRQKLCWLITFLTKTTL